VTFTIDRDTIIYSSVESARYRRLHSTVHNADVYAQTAMIIGHFTLTRRLLDLLCHCVRAVDSLDQEVSSACRHW